MEDDDSKIFPQRLMDCLSDPMNQDAICWLPHGKAFIIHNRKLFAEKVMPQYFSRKAKYSSFTRKLNRWNFTRVSSGPELGAYHHEFFLRDKPHLAAQMFCKNARTMLALASSGEEDPKTPTPDEEFAPIPLQPEPVQQMQPCEFAPKYHEDCKAPYQQQQHGGFPADCKPGYAGFPPPPSYGGPRSLKVLEQQMQTLQQQYHHAFMEHQQHHHQHHAMYNSMQGPPPPPPPPSGQHQQHEQFLQMQRMMNLGMQQQHNGKPNSKRANAA